MRPIKQCLNKQLANICQQSIELEELTQKLSALLPENLVACCHVARFNKGRLILTTPNAAWASQLRYAIPELRDRLRKEAGMYQLMSIEIIINHSSGHTEQKTKAQKAKPPKLSEEAKATIISESQFCTYEPLQQALFHLAKGDE